MSSFAIKISPTLADQGRAAADDADCSMVGQIEQTRLGGVVETKLPVASIAALKKDGASEGPIIDWAVENAKALKILRDFAENPDRTAIKEFIGVGNRVLYGGDPNDPDIIVKVQPDGTRERGAFVNRQFIPVP